MRWRAGPTAAVSPNLTVPIELRQHLAYDGKLLSAVGRIFVDAVIGCYRRRMRAERVTDGRSGSVTVV
jgi:hypothetical protein